MTKSQDNTQQANTGAPSQPPRSLAELKIDAADQLKKMLVQGKKIKDFQSNMNLMIKLYHADDSFIDNLAHSYGNLRWWNKLGLLVSIVALGACIGIACNLVIVFAVVTLVLYSAITLILENQYSAILKRDARLGVDIVELEKSLTESVQHLDEIEVSLKSVLTSFCGMNLQQAEDIQAFETQITAFEEQMKQLMAINGKLDLTRDLLGDSTQKMGEVFATVKTSWAELTDSVSKNISQLDITDQKFSTGATELLHSLDHLQQISTSFYANHSDLTKMTKVLVELLAALRIQAAATAAFNQEAADKLSYSINQTLNTTIDTDKVVSQADSTIADAMKLIDVYQGDKIRIEAQESQRHAVSKQRITTHAALERAASILASQYRAEFIVVHAPLL